MPTTQHVARALAYLLAGRNCDTFRARSRVVGAHAWGNWVGNGERSAHAAVLVIDPIGTVSATVAALALGVPIVHVRNRRDLADLSTISIAIVASYEKPVWSDVAALAGSVPTIVIGSPGRSEDVRAAIAAAAFGYLTTALAPDALKRAIKGALRGQPAYARDALGRWIRDQLALIAPEMRRAIELTPRQRAVIRLVASGASDKEIGRTLGIATATAQKHVTNLLRRLGAANPADAVAQVAVPDFWCGRVAGTDAVGVAHGRADAGAAAPARRAQQGSRGGGDAPRCRAHPPVRLDALGRARARRREARTLGAHRARVGGDREARQGTGGRHAANLG